MSAQAIVFDIGKVVLHWDVYALYVPIFGSREKTDTFLNETGLMKWNVRFDAGEPFAENIEKLAAAHPHYADAIRAFHTRWVETVPHLIDGTVSLIERLREDGVPLHAITNFAADKWELATERYPVLATAFRETVVSGQESVVKPDEAIFELLLKRAGLEADDCIFIDDSLPNVEAAAALCFDAVQFQSPEQLEEALKQRGFLNEGAA